MATISPTSRMALIGDLTHWSMRCQIPAMLRSPTDGEIVPNLRSRIDRLKRGPRRARPSISWDPSYSRISSEMRKIWTILLVAAILGQTAFLLRDYVLPWGWRAQQVLDQPRLLRSADMSLGVQATRAIQFVNH